MSIIKEIYDVAKDGTELATKTSAIKRALKTELKLNKKVLDDIGKNKTINDTRRKHIIAMLDVNELSAAVRYEIPYELICRKTVSIELAKEYSINRIKGYNLEKLVESLYLMISYLKKDFENENLDLNRRLIFIYKYNTILIQLLS